MKTQDRRPGRLLNVLVLLMGVSALVFASTRVPWAEVSVALKEGQVSWLIVSSCAGALAVALRSLRLAYISGSGSRLRFAWRAYALGYLSSLVLPLGSGELVRVAAFRRLCGLTWTRAGAVVLLDRIMDLLGLTGLFLLLLSFGGLGGLRWGPLAAIACALAFLICAIGFMTLKGDAPRQFFGVLDRTCQRTWTRFLIDRYDQAHSQMIVLATPGLGFRLTGLQFLILMVDTFGTWVSLQAFPLGVGPGLVIPMRLNLYLMIAAALPVLPGGLGSFQVACVLALHPAGVPLPMALAYALAAQGMAMVLVLAQGLVALVRAPDHILSVPPDEARD